MSYKLIVLILLIYSIGVFSQKNTVDSINLYLRKAKKNYGDERVKVLEKASLLAQKTNIDSLIKNVNIEYGIQSYYNNIHQDLTNASTNILCLFKKNKDSSLLAKHYHFKALYYKVINKIDSAYYFYNESKNISLLIKDSLATGRRYMGMAGLQHLSKDYLGSEISNTLALKYIEPLNKKFFISSIYNSFGNINLETSNFNKAREYYNYALKINKSLPNSEDKNREYLYIINNIGLTFQWEKKYKKSIPYFKKGLAFDSIKVKYPKHFTLLLQNLAYSNFELGNLSSVEDQYKTSLEINRKLNDYNNLSITHLNLALYYDRITHYNKAYEHAKMGLDYAKKSGFPKRVLASIDVISKLTKKGKRDYFRDFIRINDSVNRAERTQKNQFAKVRYETEKKEKENTLLKSENEKKQVEITYQKQQTTIGWLLGASGLLLFGLSATFFTFRRKQLVFESQLQKIEAREHERQQIAKSLHDEVAGDLRMLHQKLEKSNLLEEATKLNTVKENVRNLSHQLSSVSFHKVPFQDQIINLISDYFSLDFRIKVTRLKDIDWKPVNNSIKRLLYLSIRETIQNAQKHAEASLLTIDFSIHKKAVFLNITDNGKGFDINSNKKGIGLQNLEDRVEEVNGTLKIESELGKGTKTYIQIPLNV